MYNNYYPKHSDLVEIVGKFNKRNETMIGYLRNQYNAFENYVQSYCKDNQKFLYNRDGNTETGINFRFRNALFDVISSKNETISLLNSREVSTLYHFKPLIMKDEDMSINDHESFINYYQEYLSYPSNFRSQKNALLSLFKMLYVIRCNVCHVGKSSFGPDRAKIERDYSIAKIAVNINSIIFNILMDHPERKLACYGTLIDSPYVSKMKTKNGTVQGFVEKNPDGLLLFTNELNTGSVDVILYISSSPIVFSDIDTYEGDLYERIYIPVDCGGKTQIANIYERKYSYE